ncbi:hypothetical protein [Pelagicoccus sp. SDUM812002]|uniref:DUF4870 domain-containing protein n=1 Tax=Pelagicoccus sp. SDUM812002 TaxID=3041266 RepID=UPI00280EFD8A|nr:hypothetical protein [Pelagicoccus sp. SDUM812002]MDQ8186999.1 hypothetical protein [Pelagicoccus sp. SDUM812002]
MDPKTRGIIAYITLIGWVIALVTNTPKDEQTSFHIRQMLGIMLIGLASSMLTVIPILGLIIWPLGTIAAFVLWVIGLISAIEGSRKPVPFIGEHFQDWFKGL